MWDFRKYPVSDFSKRLLDSIWHRPVFNLRGGHHSLYAKAKELDRVKVSGCLRGGGSKGRKRAPPMGGDACHSGFRESPDPHQGRQAVECMVSHLRGLFPRLHRTCVHSGRWIPGFS